MKDILKYKDFFGSVHYSTDDEIFFGKLEGVDDLITFEGNSVKELKAAFHEAVEDYIEICIETGKQPEKSYKGTFNVRINPELHKTAARKSKELGMSLNQFIEKAIQEIIKSKNIESSF